MIVKQKTMDKRINYNIKSDTIFASASSIGISALKTIRISGKDSRKILKLLTKKEKTKPRYYSLQKIYDLKKPLVIDKAMIVWLPGPKTYTGEDMLEIHLHGGNAVIEHLIKNLQSIKNVRLAKEGEFTKRAFINNKMDLLEAEGVIDLINAETQSQKRIAMQQIEGNLSNIFNNWNSRLIKILAYCESQIDFPEEEVPKSILNKVLIEVENLKNEINLFLKDNRNTDLVRNGIHISIIGAPNVGKSSLMNQLVRKDVAIVSNISGTTRDIIETKLNLSGIPVIFFDTAGIKKKAKNIIEKKGIKKTISKIKKSDLKLVLLDMKKNFSDQIKLVDNKTIVVLNKSDLFKKNKLLSKINQLKTVKNKTEVIAISALKGTNIKKLLDKIEIFIKKNYSHFLSGEPVLTRLRHKNALKDCLKYIKKFNKQKNPELNAEELRSASRALGKITGKFDFEKLLDIVFKDFCIGK